MSLQLFEDAALLVGLWRRRDRCTCSQAPSPCHQRKQAAFRGSSHGRPLLGSGKLLPRRVLLQQALCGVVAIATPLSLGADLGDGRYLGLMELRTEDAQAFAKQLGARGEVAVLCLPALLSGRVRKPPANRQSRLWNSPCESLAPMFG